MTSLPAQEMAPLRPPPIPRAPAPKGDGARISVSALVLLAANLGIAAWALVHRFGYAELLLLYWAETVIVGVLAVPKLLIVALFARPVETMDDLREAAGRTAITVLMLVFSAVLFALLCMLLYAAIVFLPRFLEIADHDAGESFSRTLRQSGPGMEAALAGLLGSHVFSFVVNFLAGGEFRGASLLALAAQPFLRTAKIVAIIVLALGTAFLQPVLSKTTAFALVVIGAKVAVDLHAHLAERRRFATR